MFSNSHNINYRKSIKSYLLNNSLSIIYLAFTIFFFSPAAHSQDFDIPDLDSLTNSLDKYYNNLRTAQIAEFKESQKNRWLSYIPSPGYSPFTGGFTLSLNLSGPIQELNSRQLRKQKIEAIQRTNKLLSEDAKIDVIATYYSIKLSIEEYNLKDSLDHLKQKSFFLSSTQYERNLVTPSEFLSIQQNYENYKLQRLSEGYNIRRSIFLLLIKSKMAVGNDNDH